MKRQKIIIVVFMFLCVTLFLSSCANPEKNYPFAGSWQGSGSDSAGNEYVFAARVISLGDGKYRMLVLDKLDTMKKPMHVMDGVLKDNKFPHTADNGLYTGGGELTEEMFTGYYKGPVDGTYKMHRVK